MSTKGTSHLRGGDGGGDRDRGVVMVIVVVMMVMVLVSSLPDTGHKKIITRYQMITRYLWFPTISLLETQYSQLQSITGPTCLIQ